MKSKIQSKPSLKRGTMGRGGFSLLRATEVAPTPQFEIDIG
jgi:hypothetical protein